MDNNDAGDFQYDRPQLQDMTSAGTTDRLLMELLDLKRAKIRSKTAEDPDREKKDDWKLAAAVFDRILCIVFSILLVGGTVIFFVTFIVGYNKKPKG